MELQFFFGPDKIPFKLSENGMVEYSSTMPFHGIISRGLLNKFIELQFDYQLWLDCAPYLFTDTFLPEEISANFLEIQHQANSCAVLSFGQSALCAALYIKNRYQDGEIVYENAECWNVKEGHTSSVWKIVIHGPGVAETFALNVARDREAGLELKGSSLTLKTIGSKLPEISLAKVLDICSISSTGILEEVVVVKNEWIENAFEIHTRVNKQTGKEELLMVERFVTDRTNPGQIISVLGRPFTPAESKKIKRDKTEFLRKSSTCLATTPKLNINDGDLVWNGKTAVIVALS